ncbi:YaiI/YqxD family protein [Aerococcaceae bacterium NML210727]|nr:YaiI/YqxD family protein [Aerococcaceae bacterium NML210727]MCW6654990.1 YaiI/YqxD family protein [Aerococcaceae bacterium NML201296]
MRIVIDGDGSPIKSVAIDVAGKYQLPVLIVTSIAHFTHRDYPAHVQMLYVDKGADLADFKIMSLLEATDLLITQDYGLASLALTKATVLHHSGKRYTLDNIGVLLAQRYLNQKMRQAGKRVKGPRPFTAEQQQTFKESLIKTIESHFQKLKEKSDT